MSDLLHAALNRHAASQGEAPNSPPSSSLQSLHLAPDELVPVQTPAGSAFGSPTTSAASSRASSPDRNGSRSGSRKGKGKGKPPRDKTKEKAKADAGRLDPLARFPNSVSARIFEPLSAGDLFRCQGVSKKWRKSQTINYTWYRLMATIAHQQFDVPPAPPLLDPTGQLSWPRADSLADWSDKYTEAYRPTAFESDDSFEESSGDERDEEGLTLKERREARWAEENEGQNMTKVEARQYYKTLGNSKTKGKTGKGSEKTWTVEQPLDYGDPI